MRLWRPFLWCSARIRQQWNIRHSIIDAFATFLLLSYIKFLSVSGDLLLTTPVFNIHGSRIGHFMYYDGTVEFMGPQHMPYFIIAIIILVIAIMFPLLLILYPMKWFQVFLNKCHLNSPGLRMFMECFQGYYRDRSDGGWECRYFSALFPILRICGAAVYNLTQSEMCYPLLIFIATATMCFIVLINPYKRHFKFYVKIDLLFILSFIVTCTSFCMIVLSFDWDEIRPKFGFALAAVSSLVPFLYLTALVLKSMVQSIRKGCFIQQSLHLVSQWRAKQQHVLDNYEEFRASEKLIQSVG